MLIIYNNSISKINHKNLIIKIYTIKSYYFVALRPNNLFSYICHDKKTEYIIYIILYNNIIIL